MAATATSSSAAATEPSSPSHAPGPTPRFFAPVPRGHGHGHLHHGPAQRLDPMLFRAPPPHRIPFFVREIYKNGFLKRLPYSEKKSSALSKLMRSDRYWVVFSVHDDLHPFLELWNEPTEVVSKPPHYIFPLALCQHISPCIIPADNEWSFVVTFETVAIRFSCNSRQTMEEWVECLRRKLGDMGLLNAKGNLYTKIPSGPAPPKVSRNPRSPLPSPPRQAAEAHAEEQPQPDEPPASRGPADEAGNRLSIVDASDQANATFTTSIYLNQDPATSNAAASANAPPSSTTGARPKTYIASTLSLDSSLFRSYETLPDLTCPSPTGKSTSSVYLNKANETRHVTVIPINKAARKPSSAAADVPPDATAADVASDADILLEEQHVQHTPSRAPQMPKADLSLSQPHHRNRSGEEAAKTGSSKHGGEAARLSGSGPRAARVREARRNHSPSRRQRKSADFSDGESLSPPAEKGLERRHNDHQSRSQQQQRVKKRSQRSSSLGPLLDDEVFALRAPHGRGANTNSLESLDSNPRQAAARVEHRGWARRPPPQSTDGPTADPRLPPLPAPAFPPHVPLPGLTCQLTGLSLPPGVSLEPTPLQQRPHRDAQVLRLRQEMAHPAGVRLVLRRRDCHGSLALAEFLGCVWVAGWKQREFPVLHNAFHVGDQIASVSGVAVRSASDFHRLVKAPASKGQAAATAAQSEHHVEVIIRRLPLAQVFQLRRDADGQPLGIVTNGGSAEIRDVVTSSVAAQRGLTPKVRSFEGQTLVPRVITEVNGCPVSLFAKDGEAGEKLQAVGTEVSIVVMPLDIVSKMRKQLKACKSYKDFVLS